MQAMPPQWEAPRFSFGTTNQVEEWKTLYIRPIDYLEGLHIDVDMASQSKKMETNKDDVSRLRQKST